MKIALDAMGGDYAPLETVKGAVEALKENKDIKVILVGDNDKIEKELAKYDVDRDRVIIRHTTEVIEMDEKMAPTQAVRTKKDSSMCVAIDLVKSGEAMAVVSAGNTGALMTASQLKLKRIKGVLRPAITTIMPTTKEGKYFVLLDAGANADSKPEFINQYATMGSLYAKHILNIDSPRVGLLNIGEEDSKGNELTKGAFALMKENDHINFVGNVETREMMDGSVDVLATDGFTGNVVLKTAEGTIKFIKSTLREEMMKSFLGKISGLLLKKTFDRFKKRSDSTEFGGALFMGLNGISIKAHGNSDSNAIKNAIIVANKFAENRFIDELKKEFQR